MAVAILGHFPDGRDEIRVVERHAPPTDTSENRVMLAEVIVDAGIKLIEAGKARSPAELLPEVTGLGSGRTEVRQRKDDILDLFRNPIDSAGRNDVARELPAGSGIHNRNIETAEIPIAPFRQRCIHNHEVPSGFTRALIVREKEGLISLDGPTQATAKVVVNPERRGVAEEVAGVQGIAIVIVERCTAKVVGARLCDHRKVCRQSKLSRWSGRHHVHLLHSFEARLDRAGTPLVCRHRNPIHRRQGSGLRSHSINDGKARGGYRAGPGSEEGVGVKALVS